MKKQNLLLALTVIVGAGILGASYGVVPGTPKGATVSELIAYGHKNLHAVMWGSWMQLVGTFLVLLFALAIVRLTNTTGRLSGMLAMFGIGFFMAVSSIETVFYMGALYSSPQICIDIVHAVQHLYFIVAAPAVFIPLGCCMLISSCFPRWLGYLAIFFGAVFGILGIASLYILVLPTPITALASVQIIWWLLAAGVCLRLKEVRPATPLGI